MRSAFVLTALLFFSAIAVTNATASSSDPIDALTATFDPNSEETTIHVTLIDTNDAGLLDDLKQASWSLIRDGIIVQQQIHLCTMAMTNSECSGSQYNLTYYPPAGSDGEATYLVVETFLGWSKTAPGVVESVSPIVGIENLTGVYSDDITTLSWDYPESIAMNHSIMIYSHDSPATRGNWDSLTKTIVSSSVAAGTTNFEINHSSSPVEREVYYSVTLLYETSEDTRFLGSNTLIVPVKEDNIAPLFVGELSATFNSELDMTTIDWGAGISDEDLMINIYRSQMHLPILDTNNLVATVDSSLSSYELEVPMGEHRQSWYAITLVDSQGNENLNLSESSPVSDPVIESTISSSQISNLEAERYSDGTITINWDDTTQSPNAIAKIWRSVSGPISSFDDLEELASTDVSMEQYSHNPLNPVDQAWYAITIEGTWGSGSIPWYDDSLTSGVNSMENSFRETEDEIEEPAFDVLAQVQSTSGAGGEISDGDMISLGPMYEGDLIIISTSRVVENISCNDIAGQGSVIYSQTDWSLSFSANQSGEACYGTISDGDDEIGFTMTWNYIENITVVDDESDEDDTEQDDEPAGNKGSKESKETIAGVILSIIILALLVYLLVMMKGPKYFEEE